MYVILGIILVVAIVTFACARTYIHWANVQYAGEITRVNDGTFIIKTEHGAEVLVNQSPDVRIRKGRSPFEGTLQLGDFVIVAGTPNQNGSFEARVIRIMELPSSLKYENNL